MCDENQFVLRGICNVWYHYFACSIHAKPGHTTSVTFLKGKTVLTVDIETKVCEDGESQLLFGGITFPSKYFFTLMAHEKDSLQYPMFVHARFIRPLFASRFF